MLDTFLLYLFNCDYITKYEMRPITTYNPFQLKSETEMMGSPKNVPSMLNVEIVKLCSPLNQRVISLGLFPIASANCFFVIHFFCMSSSKRLEIWNESRASALSSGVMFRSSLNDVFALFITQIFHQSGFHFL